MTVSEAHRALRVISPSEGGQSKKIKSKSALTGASAVLSLLSRRSISTSSSSAPARAMFDGRTQTFSYSLSRITSFAGTEFIITSYADCSSARLLMPSPLVALPCGSMSARRTLYPLSPTAAARLTAEVVLPTPPFWLTIAITFPNPKSPLPFSAKNTAKIIP